MIRYIPHTYINREKYDQCVRLDRGSLIYALSWYLDTVCESWDVLVLDDYEAVWPLPVRTKFGFTYFYRPFAVQQLGIFSREELSPGILDRFAKQLTRHCSFAEIFLNSGQAISPSPNISLMENQNFLLNINRKYQNIYEGYSKGLRRNIRKAEKRRWQIMESDSPRVLINLFRDNRGARERIPDQFFLNMEKVMYASLHRQTGYIWTVYSGPNELCAGIFVVEHAGRLTVLFTGLSENGKKWGAMPYLINEFIIFQSGKKFLLDFEGSNNPGIARFYAGFGAYPTYYERLKYNGLPLVLKWLK